MLDVKLSVRCSDSRHLLVEFSARANNEFAPEKLILQLRDGRANVTIFILPFVTGSNSSPITMILAISKFSILERNWVGPTLLTSNLFRRFGIRAYSRKHTRNRRLSGIGSYRSDFSGRARVIGKSTARSRGGIWLVKGFHDSGTACEWERDLVSGVGRRGGRKSRIEK
jgi:hypothetical protein